MTLMKSDAEGSTQENVRPDPLANLLEHLRACFPDSEQDINMLSDLGWRVAVGSAAARGDGRATVRAARAAIGPLVADGSFTKARAATVYVFGACRFWRQEIDAAVAVVRQAAVPGAEIFGWSLSEAGLGDDVQVYVVLYAFADELEALAVSGTN